MCVFCAPLPQVVVPPLQNHHKNLGLNFNVLPKKKKTSEDKKKEVENNKIREKKEERRKRGDLVGAALVASTSIIPFFSSFQTNLRPTSCWTLLTLPVVYFPKK